MSALWTSAEAAAATGGEATVPFEVTGLSIDTRSIAPGELFVALKDRRDGHDFVAAALAAGAGAALVERRPEGVADDAPLLIVPDVMEALRALARAARKRTRAKVIGITGSVGKTSTKDMLRHALAAQGTVHAAEKSFNNHWGVPLTLARCPRDADFAVIEIGMNHPGEIAPLARLADLDVAIITIVAAAHLEAFDNLEGIAHEKAAIMEGLRPGGTAVLNGDLAVSPILLDAAEAVGAQICRFGKAPAGDIELLDSYSLAGQTQATLMFAGMPLALRLNLPGSHFVMNGLAVLGACKAVGADIAKALQALADWQPPAGRGTKETLHLPQGEITLLDDAYNANPTSMGAGFEVLAATGPETDGRRIAVLGDMLELGPEEAALHAGLADHPAMAAIDGVLAVGPRMAALDQALPADKRLGHVGGSEAAAQALLGLVRPGDVILVKGSLGSRVAQVVTALRSAATTD